MLLCEALKITPGVTAVIGGGGKSSLIGRLAGELAPRGSVITCTTTHILPFEGMPLLTGANEAAVAAALKRHGAVCVGEYAAGHKLVASQVGMDVLKRLADYVLVEADGSAGRPLKAHAAHEPALPRPMDRLLYVVGADGVGLPVAEAAHRPELYAAGLGVEPCHIVTPQDAAGMIKFDCTVVINKAEGERQAVAWAIARRCKSAVLTCLKSERAVIGLWTQG